MYSSLWGEGGGGGGGEGGDEYGKSSHLTIFTSLKHFVMMSLINFFFRTSFLHLIKDTDTMIAHRNMQLRLFKVETLL